MGLSTPPGHLLLPRSQTRRYVEFAGSLGRFLGQSISGDEELEADDSLSQDAPFDCDTGQRAF